MTTAELIKVLLNMPLDADVLVCTTGLAVESVATARTVPTTRLVRGEARTEIVEVREVWLLAEAPNAREPVGEEERHV